MYWMGNCTEASTWFSSIGRSQSDPARNSSSFVSSLSTLSDVSTSRILRPCQRCTAPKSAPVFLLMTERTSPCSEITNAKSDVAAISSPKMSGLTNGIELPAQYSCPREVMCAPSKSYASCFRLSFSGVARLGLKLSDRIFVMLFSDLIPHDLLQ